MFSKSLTPSWARAPEQLYGASSAGSSWGRRRWYTRAWVQRPGPCSTRVCTHLWLCSHQQVMSFNSACALNHHQVLGAWRGVCAVALFALGFRTLICHPHLWMEKVQLLQPLLLSRKNVQKDPIHFRLINFRVKNLHYEMLIHPANYSMVWYQFLINWFILS